MKFKDVIWMSPSTDSTSSVSEVPNEPLGGTSWYLVTATEVESQKSVIAFLDFSIFYIQCVLCSSAPARREAEVLTDPACLLDWTGTGHVSQQTLGCCPPPGPCVSVWPALQPSGASGGGVSACKTEQRWRG